MSQRVAAARQARTAELHIVKGSQIQARHRQTTPTHPPRKEPQVQARRGNRVEAITPQAARR